MISVRAIVFDLDGTLIDSALTILDILNRIRTERGATPIELATLRPHLSKGGRTLVAEALAEVAADPDGDLARFRQDYRVVRQGPEIVFPEVEGTLHILQAQGWKLGVCTNKPRVLADNALSHTGLERFFPVMVAGDDGHPSKPHPASLIDCCERLGIAPGQAIYVGDSEVDRDTAASAGCPFAFVEYGYAIGDPGLIECELRMKSLGHLLELLTQLPTPRTAVDREMSAPTMRGRSGRLQA